MIIDHIANAHLYTALHPAFSKAFDFLQHTDFTQYKPGKYEIDGENLFLLINEYETESPEMRFWEGHRKYIDIQYMVQGEEIMQVAPRHTLKLKESYDHEKEYAIFEGTGEPIKVKEGYFVIFFPTDVHMPNLLVTKQESVRKAVFKIKLQSNVLQLCMATQNKHKVEEIQYMLGDERIELQSLQDLGITEQLPETGDTLEYNAWQKSNHVFSLHGMNCFADDTGLEVESLHGRPGVYSARYAGENATFTQNVSKLLNEMQGITNRNARFRTVISLMMNSTEYRFEGTVEGSIAEAPIGSGGFGYDAVFIPKGHKKTFAEMSMEEKNSISHRRRAIQQMIDFLKKEYLSNEM